MDLDIVKQKTTDTAFRNKKGRVVNIGPYKCTDLDPGFFPNAPFKFFDSKVQINDPLEFALNDSIQVNAFDKFEKEATIQLRSVAKRLGRYFPMSKLTQKPMRNATDGLAMILPLDNKVNKSWLTYHDPQYIKFATDLCDNLLKEHKEKEVEDAVRIILTDYSTTFPFASVIRHDGRMTISRTAHLQKLMKVFKKKMSFYLNREFDNSSMEDFAKSMNVDKSPGWPYLEPDGSEIDVVKYLHGPESYWHDGVPSPYLVKNYKEHKLDWLKSGRVWKSFVLQLEHPDWYDDPGKIPLLFERGAMNVHTEAYRTNNGDPFLNEINGSVKPLLGKLYHKNRDFSYEIGNYQFVSGVQDSRKVSNFYATNGLLFNYLKKRPMFPGANASFALPGIIFCWMLLHRVEESSSGFPSNQPNSLERRRLFIEKQAGKNLSILNFDRRTSEQFITDNMDFLLEIIPDRFREFINSLSTACLPSLFGPRITKGLPSGHSLTTFDNVYYGIFETFRFMTIMAGKINEPDLEEICDRVLKSIFDEVDFSYDGIEACITLGTDDQGHYVAAPQEAYDRVKKSDFEDFFLSGGFDKEVHMFGMHWTTTSLEVDDSLGLSKYLLMENDTNGDRSANRMKQRRMVLPKYLDTIDKTYFDNNLGDPATFDFGEIGFDRTLGLFGKLSYNEYSLKEKLIYGGKELNLGESNNYPNELIEPFFNELKKL